MIPIIDISKVENDKSFERLARIFDLLPRLELYNKYARTGNKSEAVKMLKIIKCVLDGHDSKRETIIEEGLEKAAGTALAAVDYALLTIDGKQPAIPFNKFSTPELIVLLP